MRRAAGVLAAVGGALLLAWASRAPMRLHAAEDGMVRVAWSARPDRVERCVTRSDEELRDVPAHMRQRTVCEGRSARYRLEVRRDGVLLADEVVTGAGARHDRPLYLFREFPTRPGAHAVEVTFRLLDSIAPPAREAAERDDLLADREGREVQERARRRREAVPPQLELAVKHMFAARSVLLITYDADARALVARSTAGSP